MNIKPALYAFLVLTAASAFAAPVRPAIETTIKGASGVEAKMKIVAVWADGFHIAQGAGRAPMFVAWEKVDAAWLEAERPELAKLKKAAKPFPALTEEQARAKIDEARKTFRASREVVYSWVSPDLTKRESRTAPNAIAASYAAKLKTITPANITQSLAQIVADRDRDLERLSGKGGADGAQALWLSTQFNATLAALERVQREVDPVNAGLVVLTTPTRAGYSSDPFAPKANTEEGWF